MKRRTQFDGSPGKPQKQPRLEARTQPHANTINLTEALDFTIPASPQEVSDRFVELARLLMFNHIIHLHTPGPQPGDIEYEILELEFYLHKPECHADPFTHRASEQRRSGQWYFHRTPTTLGVSTTSYRGGSRKGMDLTFGSPITFLPDSAPGTNSDSIRGPSRLVDEILGQSGAQSISELVQSMWKDDTFALTPTLPNSRPSLRIIPRTKYPTSTIPIRCPRIGLDLSHRSTTNSPWDPRLVFVCKPYRYVVSPELLRSSGRPQTFVGVYDRLSGSAGGDTAGLAKAIADVTGIREQTVLRYIKNLGCGLEGSRSLDKFIRTKTRSVADYLSMVGALRRQNSSVVIVEADAE